jgi:hypothetical protein
MDHRCARATHAWALEGVGGDAESPVQELDVFAPGVVRAAQARAAGWTAIDLGSKAEARIRGEIPLRARGSPNPGRAGPGPSGASQRDSARTAT